MMGRGGDRETINMIGRRGDGVMGRLRKTRKSGHQDIRISGDREGGRN
jgi:hypothetical protein